MRVHSVKLPERDFVAAPVKKYLSTTAFKTKLDALCRRRWRASKRRVNDDSEMQVLERLKATIARDLWACRSMRRGSRSSSSTKRT